MTFEPLPTLAAKAIIRGAAGHVLLLRSWKQSDDHHSWDLPGGLVEPGEDATEAVVREVLEETGLAVAVVKLGTPWSFTRHSDGERVAVETFVCSLLSPEAHVVLSDEHIDYGWFAPHLIGQLRLKDDSLLESIRAC